MIGQSLLPEFDHEVATTRKVLARVPADKLDWLPHPKSFSMGALSSHIVNLVAWTPPTMNLDLMDIEPDGVPWKSPEYTSVEALLDALEQNSQAARKALADASDKHYMGMWSLAKNGAVIMTMPRIAVIRSFIFNHLVHHRGQLSVYLRLTGAEVPSIYGPSADDPGGM